MKNVFIRVSIFNTIYFLVGAAVFYVLDLSRYLLIPLGLIILLWARYSYKMNVDALRREIALKMEDKEGVAVEEINPYGLVKIGNEYWRAYADSRISEGERVKVIKVEGLTVIVGVASDKG
ncbi:MAG: NfeD family protein [Euryarchaeota archaeon]|nr:NfeD family protein [Euryarchaeota archaeon]